MIAKSLRASKISGPKQSWFRKGLFSPHLTQRFSEDRVKATLTKYLSVLEKNRQKWEEILPTEASEKLNFYDPKHYHRDSITESLELIWDMMNRKGKKIRPVMMLNLADIYGIPQKEVIHWSYMVETIHNCTLIVDDIEDNSTTRRGEPCSHIKYGVDKAINSGILGYFLTMALINRLPEVKKLSTEKQLAICHLIIEEMKNIHLGLAWDIGWHGKTHKIFEDKLAGGETRIEEFSTLPSEKNYIEMVESKTSVLMRIGFRLIGEIGNLDPANKEVLSKLANYIGTSFQIQDDLVNLLSEEYSQGRGGIIGDDITEGKITLMVIEHIKRTKDQAFLNQLGKSLTEQAPILELIQQMKDSGAIEYANQKQIEYSNKANSLLDSIKGDQESKENLQAIIQGLIKRKK